MLKEKKRPIVNESGVTSYQLSSVNGFLIWFVRIFGGLIISVFARTGSFCELPLQSAQQLHQ